MELTLTTQYIIDIGRDYFVDNLAEIRRELSAACKSYGIRAVRSQLKKNMEDRSLSYPIPLIVKTLNLHSRDGDEDQHWFKKSLQKYLLDGKEVYSNGVIEASLSTAVELGIKYYVVLFDPITQLNVLARTPLDGNNTTYGGYPAHIWYEYGDICEDCGSAFIRTPTTECVCRNCQISHQVRSYSHKVEEELGYEEVPETKPNTVIKNIAQSKERLFGIELEYEDVTARQVFKTLKGHAVPKSDSSINSGVEVVTRPARIVTHKDCLKKFFNEVTTKDSPNTGMHIHVERKGLSEYRIGFMMEFLNKEELSSKIINVAGRDFVNNTYTRRKKEHTMTWGMYEDQYGKVKRESTDKYSPVNTRKPHTIEIRIFASPKTAEECFARLDFVNALVKYSSPYSVSVKSLKDKFNWDLFKGFVKDNRREFPDFYNMFVKGDK